VDDTERKTASTGLARDDVKEGQIDVDALRCRYEEERRRRLRPDATAQYQKLAGQFARFADDPFADPGFTREPIAEETDVLIVGAGFGGLLAAARLRDEGVDSLRLIDKAGDFGGTWYWNRYPGVACDVESYIYLPLLEETGYLPVEKYARGGEILEHCRRIARHYRLYEAALFQTQVTGVVWKEERKRWLVSTHRGDQIAARFFVSGKGLYSAPKLPGIPGIESFEGHSFHTSRWDYNYTGGDSGGKLDKLADKVVGVIGTGATGLQCVPALAQGAKRLYVFQRTPSSVDERNNRPTDPEWARALEPGWRQKRLENFTMITSGVPQSEDLIDDSWTEIFSGLPSAVTGGAGAKLDPAEIERAQFAKMERMRRRIDAVVQDKATAKALKPYYHYLCKRPGFSDEYLQTFNRPNVTLVDTEGRGVERITSKGVVAGGREYPLDLLVYATGFDYMSDYAQEAGFELTGRGGLTLSQHWAEGPLTLYGMQTSGFPNFFMISLIQSGISFNYIHTADEQAKHIAHIVRRCLNEQVAAVEPTPEAEAAWVDLIVAHGAGRRAFLDACTPSYINQEGHRDRSFDLIAPYASGPVAYFAELEAWRTEASMRGLRVERRMR
jgi:cyclohexanone monooxygenase